MNFLQRFLLGLVFMLLAFLILWWGSPVRTQQALPEPTYALVFVLIFAIGFIVASMAVLGMKSDYPGFLSGVVLYFMVGALVSVVLYVTSTEVGRISLEDSANPDFWMHWVRVSATWPLEFVQRAGLWGYDQLIFGS
jgi:hypothetical protein